MVVHKRKKFSNTRVPHKQHGKRHRGSGNRGGVGRAGRGKRGKQKNQMPAFLGTLGKYRLKPKTKPLAIKNISDLPESGKVELKHTKLLGTGSVRAKLTVTCTVASKKAIEKIEAKGGSVALTNPRAKEE